MIFVDEDNMPFNKSKGSYSVNDHYMMLLSGGRRMEEICRPDDKHLKLLMDKGPVWCVDAIHNN